MADEAADFSVKEQLSLRFVDDESNIREEFLEFIHCEDDTSGKAISEVILVQLGVDIRKLSEWQGYYEAGDMPGRRIKVLVSIFKIGLRVSLPGISIKSLCC